MKPVSPNNTHRLARLRRILRDIREELEYERGHTCRALYVLLILDLHLPALASSTYRPISFAKQTGNTTNLLHTNDCRKRKSQTRLKGKKQELRTFYCPCPC